MQNSLTSLEYDSLLGVRYFCCIVIIFIIHLYFSLSDEVREKMKSRYLNNPDYNFEKVNHASNACGPLVKWACAQIQYADMLKKVEPLREELNSLEKQAETNKQRGEEVKSLIAQLEQSIASYKEEYAQLIAQAQAIKTDLENVQAKVDRSIALLKSLVIERERWEATSETFRSQMSTIIGDVLLSAAFIAYGELIFQLHFLCKKIVLLIYYLNQGHNNYAIYQLVKMFHIHHP